MYFKIAIKKATLVLLLIFASSLNLLANEIVTMAIGEWLPYTSEKNSKGKIAEVIVTEAFKLENIDTLYKYFPWKRSFVIVKKGRETGTFLWSKTEEREKEFIITKEPIIKIKTVFFHLKNLDFKWENFQDLKKYKIGGALGYKEVKFLQDKGLIIDVASKEKQCFIKLLKGRIEILPASLIVGYSTINSMFSADKAALFTNNPKPLFDDLPMFILISKKIPNGQIIADLFDKGLKKLKASGRYDEIIATFLSVK